MTDLEKLIDGGADVTCYGLTVPIGAAAMAGHDLAWVEMWGESTQHQHVFQNASLEWILPTMVRVISNGKPVATIEALDQEDYQRWNVDGWKQYLAGPDGAGWREFARGWFDSIRSNSERQD